MNYMGIDHHKQYSHITLMDDVGEVIKSGAHVKKVVYESEKYFVIDSNFKGRIIL